MSELKIRMLSPEDRFSPGEVGEIGYDAEADQYYYCTGAGWEKIPNPKANMELKLIDLNKQIISQIENYTEEDFINAMDITCDYMNINPGKYYMLLCKDYNYYTLFELGNIDCPSLPEELMECLQNIGPVKAFDMTDDKDAIEIWVMVDDEPYVMYFFNYDRGVVKCQ